MRESPGSIKAFSDIRHCSRKGLEKEVDECYIVGGHVLAGSSDRHRNIGAPIVSYID